MIIYISRKEGLKPIAIFCPLTRKSLAGKLMRAQRVNMSTVYLPVYGHIHSIYFNDGYRWNAINGWNSDINVEAYLELYEQDAKAVVAFAQQGYYRNAISAQEVRERIKNDLADNEKSQVDK